MTGSQTDLVREVREKKKKKKIKKEWLVSPRRHTYKFLMLLTSQTFRKTIRWHEGSQ